MVKLILRFVVAICISVLMTSCFNIHGNDGVLQTLFTILGIVFSLGMGLLVSFKLSEVKNSKIRKDMRHSLSHTLKLYVGDFGLTSFVFLISLLIYNGKVLKITDSISVDYSLSAICVCVTSIAYEVYNFTKIDKLNVDIEEEIINEHNNKYNI